MCLATTAARRGAASSGPPVGHALGCIDSWLHVRDAGLACLAWCGWGWRQWWDILVTAGADLVAGVVATLAGAELSCHSRRALLTFRTFFVAEAVPICKNGQHQSNGGQDKVF